VLCIRFVIRNRQESYNFFSYINGTGWEILRKISNLIKIDYNKHVIHLNSNMLHENFWVTANLTCGSHCTIRETEFHIIVIWTKFIKS
jgi:hypothetical protein